MTKVEADVELQRSALRRQAERIAALEARLGAVEEQQASDGQRLDCIEDRIDRNVMIMDAFRDVMTDLVAVDRQLGAAGRDELALAAAGGRDQGDDDAA